MAGSATVLASPLAAAASLAASAPLRVGVVLPPSHRFPKLSERFLAGFRAGVAGSAGVDVIPIPAEAMSSAPFAAAMPALEQGRIDLVAGLGDRNAATRMSPMLRAHGVPLLVSDLGADIAREGRENPWVVRGSFGYWQSN